MGRTSVIWIWLSNPRIHLKLWNVLQILLIRLMVGQRGAFDEELFLIKSFIFQILYNQRKLMCQMSRVSI